MDKEDPRARSALGDRRDFQHLELKHCTPSEMHLAHTEISRVKAGAPVAVVSSRSSKCLPANYLASINLQVCRRALLSAEGGTLKLKFELMGLNSHLK